MTNDKTRNKTLSTWYNIRAIHWRSYTLQNVRMIITDFIKQINSTTSTNEKVKILSACNKDLRRILVDAKKRKKLMILVRKILILDLMYSPQREGSQREQK